MVLAGTGPSSAPWNWTTGTPSRISTSVAVRAAVPLAVITDLISVGLHFAALDDDVAATGHGNLRALYGDIPALLENDLGVA